MKRSTQLKAFLAGSTCLGMLATAAFASGFNIPGGDLATALDTYSKQTGVAVLVSGEALRGVKTKGAKGELSADAALASILSGTGFTTYRSSAGAIGITREDQAPHKQIKTELAQAEPVHAAASVETVVVTSSKIKGDIQTVPIAITALSQEQLTSRQIAGGPDLVKDVPNLTFTKTNFTGYDLQIRGIGTQAISVTIDPAVAVAFNDTPFLRNHFFEQEFFDLNQVEVLRGPQGTLYGRNANAGVVNIISAKPTNQFEAMLSADFGNYTNRRYEGMINIPIVDDKLALRVAGEWTKRDGYAFNETSGKQTDGRDLWSSRATLRWKPVESVTADFIWEHFQENDDRLRSGKQLCKTDPGPSTLTTADGTVIDVPPAHEAVYNVSSATFSQGCLPVSLYDKGDPAHGDYGAFGVPNGFSMPWVTGGAFVGLFDTTKDPYTSASQSTNLRDIQSQVDPQYRANNDTLELNAEWNVTPALTFDSETGYNRDFLWSTEDYNRFDTAPGVFKYDPFRAGSGLELKDPAYPPFPGVAILCDPQLGCSDRLVVQDLATEQSWQLSQEFRLASNFSGPFNFSAGGNYLHYETDEKYYVFSNVFSLLSITGPFGCSQGNVLGPHGDLFCQGNGKGPRRNPLASNIPTEISIYLDPGDINHLNDNGHNYFLSKNPYILNSYALFGEAYYNLTNNLKLTGGVRWTDDQKHFPEFPSRVITSGYGVTRTDQVDQSWEKFSGRAVVNWMPKLDFTDQTMIYGSYSHGYKAGGANPPPAGFIVLQGQAENPVHPLTFDPEYIDAFELGTKNTALDGALVFDADVFYYDYTGYQISQIVDRTSVNINVNATVQGAEIQTTWEPLQGLKFGFNGGYEDTRIKDNQYFIDLMDRTAGNPNWIVMKPFPTQASNCIFPEYVAAALVQGSDGKGQGNPMTLACGNAYPFGTTGVDPVTGLNYDAETSNGTIPPSGHTGFFSDPPPGYPGYDPLSIDPNLGSSALATVNNGLGLPPNNGEGFAKNVGGKTLPNAPHFTASLTGDYTMPVSANWAATLHSDFYWQSQS